MTPKEYHKIKEWQKEIIADAEARILAAFKQASKCKPPKKRRPALANDIAIGAIIWHEREKEHGGDFWNIVAEPLHYGDAFKAYVDEEGDRYGLQGAYIDLD